jgi:hypothetical protein
VKEPTATTTVSPSHKAIGVCPEMQCFRAFFMRVTKREPYVEVKR